MNTFQAKWFWYTQLVYLAKRLRTIFIRKVQVFSLDQSSSVFDDDFFIYEVKNDEEIYCRENFKLATLCYEEGKTKLKFNGIVEFEGKAFDFDLELVTLKLERGTQDLDDYFYLKKLQETCKKIVKNFKSLNKI